MQVFLNTYEPICATKQGRIAVENHGVLPFVDGSCRREPDFESIFPAITNLCRPGLLVPRLREGNLVIYLSKKYAYGTSQKHWKLVTILEVIRLFRSHEQAGEWYIAENHTPSHNIFVRGIHPKPYHLTHGKHGIEVSKHQNPEQIVRRWNGAYKERVRRHSGVAVCQIWNGVLNLSDPMGISEAMMRKVFHRIPGTRNPPQIRSDEWARFQEVVLGRIRK